MPPWLDRVHHGIAVSSASAAAGSTLETRTRKVLLRPTAYEQSFTPGSPLGFPVRRGDVVPGDLSHRAGATIPHREFQFALKDFENTIDTGLAERSESPQHRTPDPYCLGAQSETLEHISAAAEAAVDEHWDAAADFGHHFRQGLDGSARGLGGTPAVIRDQDAVQAVLEAKPCVLAGVDSLDDEFSLPEFSDAINISPVHGWIRPAHAGHVDTVVHGMLLDRRTGFAFVARGALAEVFRTLAQVGLAVAPGGVVDGKGDHRAPGGFHPLEDLVADIPGGRRVELLPDRAAERFVDIL